MDDVLIIEDEDKAPEEEVVLEDPVAEDGEGAASEHKIAKNPDGTVTLTLRHPFKVRYRRGDKEREETFTELKFRRPSGGDFIAIDNIKAGDVRTAAELICRLIGQPLAIFEKIDAYDLTGCGEILESFFPPSRRTSKT